ncbi:MAG: SdrD B-like domain-containing protein [Actinomycetota bacterium]
MSPASSRRRVALVVLAALVALALVVVPSAQAEDRGTLTVSTSVIDAPGSTRTNDTLVWRVEISCTSDAADCGSVSIQDELSAGLDVVDIELSRAIGYVASLPVRDEGRSVSIVSLTRAEPLLDGETLTYQVTTRVTGEANAAGSVGHLVTTSSTNATPPTSTPDILPVLVEPDWHVRQLVDADPVAAAEAFLGSNVTHPVAFCSSTLGSVAHGALALELMLPAGTIVIEPDGATVTPTGLSWALPPVDAAALAEEHDRDVAAGRIAERCHQFFPILRWASPDFVLGQFVDTSVAVSDPTGVGGESVCAARCTTATARELRAAATEISAWASGSPVVDAGGFQRWDVGFDASLAGVPIEYPMLEIDVPIGFELHELGLPAEAATSTSPLLIHLSTDRGASFQPTPIDTSTLVDGRVTRSLIDGIVGPGVPISALQIRWVSLDGTVAQVAPGSTFGFDMTTRGESVAAGVDSAVEQSITQLCATASAANAATLGESALGCATAEVVSGSPLVSIGATTSAPSGPTVPQPMDVTVVLPIDNGAPLIDPTVAVLLPEGFDYGGFEGVTSSPNLAPMPDPIVEVVDDFGGADRTLIRLLWTDREDLASAHTVRWTAAEMVAGGSIEPADFTIGLEVIPPPGAPSGPHRSTVAVTSAIAGPRACGEGAFLVDDLTGRGGGAVLCETDHDIVVTDAALVEVTTWAAGEALLPALPLPTANEACTTRRTGEASYSSGPCSVAAVPNGRVELQTVVTNLGNRELTDHWTYGLLPSIEGTGIDPADWSQVPSPSASDWRGTLAGPVTVGGLPPDPDREPGDVIVEYSTAADPCRTELADSAQAWPPECVNDWFSAAVDFSKVTAWRVNVPLHRTPLPGAASYSVDWTMVLPPDAEFESLAHAVTSHAASGPSEPAPVRSASSMTSIRIPSEADIVSADPQLLPYDLALTARVDRTASADLADGPSAGDEVIVDVAVLNQGTPVNEVRVVLHALGLLEPPVATGTAAVDDGSTISWSIAGGASPAELVLRGPLDRGATATLALPFRIADGWAGEALNLVAEISDFDPDGLPGGNAASGAVLDHDSVPDRDPDNDLAPSTAGAPGDDVTTGDGIQTEGEPADPVGDDEDDHDPASVPVWDLALGLELAPGQAPTIDWTTRTVDWQLTVTNEGSRTAHDIEIEHRLPLGLVWVQTLEAQASGLNGASTASVVAEPIGGALGTVYSSIDGLAAGESISWVVTTSVIDPQQATFVFESAIVAFDDDGDPETALDELVLDWDRASGDAVDNGSAFLPYDLGVAIEHRATRGFPVATGVTSFDLAVILVNEGRPVDHATIELPVAGLPFATATPDVDPATLVDQDGRPMRVAWDFSDAEMLRVQIGRVDGTPLVHGDRVEAPVRFVLSEDVDTRTLDITATLVGFRATDQPTASDLASDGAETDPGAPIVDNDPSDDSATARIPMWDLALDVEAAERTVRLLDDGPVIAWTLTLVNQGNQPAFDVEIANVLPLGTRFLSLGEIPDAAVSVLAGGTEDDPTRVRLGITELLVGQSRTVEVLLDVVEGWDDTFIYVAEIAGFAPAPGETFAVVTPGSPFPDADSRVASLLSGDSTPEDDGASLEVSLPIDVDVAVDHVATSGLPIGSGTSSMRFDLTVRNEGRPLGELELQVEHGDATFRPLEFEQNAARVVVDSGDGDELAATWAPTAAGAVLQVVGRNETLGGGDPEVTVRRLDPGESITVPIVLDIANNWDGRPLVIEVIDPSPDDGEGRAVSAEASLWDLALGAALAPGQPAEIDTTTRIVRWAITVKNQGNRSAHRIGVVDALPAGMAWVGPVEIIEGTAAVTTGAIAGDQGVIVFSVDELQPDETVTFAFATEAVDTSHTLFTNIAEISWFDDDPDPANAVNALAVDVDSTPNLDLNDDAILELASLDTDFDLDGDRNLNEAGIDATGATIDEDDHATAQASLPYDAAISVELDDAGTTFPVQAGSVVAATLTITNQGADLQRLDAEITLLPEVFAAFDPARNPDGVTTGDAIVGYSWVVDGPVATISLEGALTAGQAVVVPVALTLGETAAVDGAVSIAAAIVAIDDDLDPDDPPPELADADGDAVTSLDIDVADLALGILLDPTTALPVAAESTVTFFIDVINQGSVATNAITAYVTLDATGWSAFDPGANPDGSTGGDLALDYAWSADGLNGIVTLDGTLAAGQRVAIPLVATLAAGADLDSVIAIAEVSGFVPLSDDGTTPATHPGGTPLVDVDSAADTDPTNDAQPAAPGDPTDGAVANESGDEDDHDIAGVVPDLWDLGNQVWFDLDGDGSYTEGEEPAAGIAVALYVDANLDGIADDLDDDGSVDEADRLQTTTTDADGLYRFNSLISGGYVVELPASEFVAGGPLEGWFPTGFGVADPNGEVDGDSNALARPDGSISSGSIAVGQSAPVGEDPSGPAGGLADERSDLTIDFGLGRFSIGNSVYARVEVASGDVIAQPVEGALLRLYQVVPTLGGTTPDPSEPYATTRTDEQGFYLFAGIPPGQWEVVLAGENFETGGVLNGFIGYTPATLIEPDADGDNNGVARIGTGLGATVTLGDGEPLGESPNNDPLTPDGNSDLTIDFLLEEWGGIPVQFPDLPPSFGPAPTAFGGNNVGGFNGFGAADPLLGGGDVDGPSGPLAFTGGNASGLISWAMMLIVIGAVFVGVARDPDED